MSSPTRWQLPVVRRLGLQHGLTVGWFLLIGVIAILLVPGPAGGTPTENSLLGPQSVTLGDQSHCGIVVGVGASSGGSGSGDVRCTSVESGGDSQVTTDGFGDIGMQSQQSPVAAPISNVHVSNEGDNNSNNSIIGNSDQIINGNIGASAGAAPAADAGAAAPALPGAAPDTSGLAGGGSAPAADVGSSSSSASAVAGNQSHCGVVAGIGASGGGSGSGDTSCTSVESGRDSQVTTGGFGDIGMQFQQSPVNAPITNVHISNEGNNNSNNTIVGDHNLIINANLGITINT